LIGGGHSDGWDVYKLHMHSTPATTTSAMATTTTTTTMTTIAATTAAPTTTTATTAPTCSLTISPQKSTSASWSQSGSTVTFSGSGMPSDSVYNMAYFGCPATDSEFEVVVNFQGDNAGIIMRAVPAAPGGEDLFYMCRLDSRPSGTTGISIIKSSDENPHYPGWPFGWPRQIEWGKKPADAKHSDVRLRMSCTGNQIRCYKDGVLMVSATDSSLASGVYGLATWSWPQDKDSSATFTIVTQA